MLADLVGELNAVDTPPLPEVYLRSGERVFIPSVCPSPAIHAVLAELKVGECIRQNSVLTFRRNYSDATTVSV